MFWAAVVSLGTLLVYLPALQYGFVNWDDNLYVYENPHIRSFSWALVKWAFTEPYAANWHPVTWFSHAFDRLLWGLNPLGHHLTSIILHAANSFLVVFVAVNIVRLADRTLSTRGLIACGVATGVLFGVHPLHVESVAWVAERKDLLCALFFLSSLLSYIKYATGAGNVRHEPSLSAGLRDRWYLLSLLLFVLALLSKPMAVSLPLVLLIMDWYPLDRTTSSARLRAALVEKAPFVLGSLASSVMTIWAQGAWQAIVPVDYFPLSTRLLVAARSLLAYLVNMVLPLKLIPYYPYPQDVSLLQASTFLPLAAVLAITAAWLLWGRRHRALAAVWAYYCATLLPVLGIVQVGGQAMADRYTYLPSLGPFLLAGYGFARLVDFCGKRDKGRAVCTAAGVSLAVALTLVLSFKSVRQIAVWKHSVTLWSYVIEASPRQVLLAYYNRGLVFGKNRAFARALADFNQAVSINGTFSKAYNNRGVVYFLTRMYPQALQDFTQAVDMDPENSEAYVNRAYVYLATGRRDLAIPDLQKGCELGNQAGCTAFRQEMGKRRP